MMIDWKLDLGHCLVKWPFLYIHVHARGQVAMTRK